MNTMNGFRYILEPYKGMNSRHTCPGCNNRKVFTFYIDTTTGEPLPEQFGKCNRSDKCGYHLNPYKDGYSQMIYEQEQGEFKEDRKALNQSCINGKKWQKMTTFEKPKTVSFIPVELFKTSLQVDSYEQNNFVKYLNELFGNEITAGLISKYFIGTSKHWPGANIFWQIDIAGKIRSGKIMLYNPTTGKRIKEPFNYITWVHTVIKQPEFELKQCFFGEYLLMDKSKPVAIVESEKTAIIASVYYPQFIWIAAGNKNGLSAQKCEVLTGRQVILYPDLSKPQPDGATTFGVWKAKARELATIANFTVNQLLETKAGEDQRKEGCDLADYLINFDYKEFIEPQPEPMQPERIKEIEPVIFKQPVIWEPESLAMPAKKINVYKTEKKTPTTWSYEVTELEKYFSLVTMPVRPVKLNPCSTIVNIPLFIETHFATIKANDGNKFFLPFLNRLQDLKQLLNTL